MGAVKKLKNKYMKKSSQIRSNILSDKRSMSVVDPKNNFNTRIVDIVTHKKKKKKG